MFVCIISHTNSADAREDQTNDTDSQSSVGRLFYNGSLSEKQKKSIVTIEFNCNDMDTAKNRTAVDSMYRNVHREILKSLNSRKPDLTTPHSLTSLAATSATPTPTPTPMVITMSTTRTTTTGGVPSEKKKRKRRQQTSNGDIFDAKDLRFVPIDPETDDHGVLVMSLLLIVKETDKRDCGVILYHATNQTYKDGTLGRAAGVPVVAIHRGLPANREITEDAMNKFDHTILIWPLVILAVILTIVVIGCVVFWKKRQGRLDVTNQEK
jgi:hypothetical protein